MKNTLLFVFITISSFNVSGQSAENYFFFSQQDVENIRFSTNKAWGISIVDSLTRLVDNRLRYSMEVPMLEGGHSHQYFCPIHNIRLSFDWDKPTAHFCAQCNKEWTKEVKFNWAWVTHLHNRNHEFLNACAYLYIATNKSEYAEYIKELLLDYALKYPTYMLHDIRRKQVAFQSGKMYGQSLDEAVFRSEERRVGKQCI